MTWITLIIICSFALLQTKISARHHPYDIRYFDAGIMQSSWLVNVQPYYLNVTCGGALISSSWVLSIAWQCTMDSTEFLITSGTSIIPEKYPAIGSDIIPTNLTIVNEQYLKDYRHENNILLIKLLNDVSETDFVKYIRLPKKSAKYSLGSTAVSSAWGIFEDDPCCPKVTDTEMTLVLTKNCKKSFSSSELKKTILCGQGDLAETIDHSHIGGSLVADENDGIPSLIGLLSFHAKNLTNYSNIFVGYVKVVKHLDWINEKTGIPIRS